MSGNETEKNINLGGLIVTLIFLLALSAAGFFLILYSISKYGPGSTHDSVAYMYAAESLMEGKELKYFGYDTPFVQWPPFFPVVLSGLSFLYHDLIMASGYLNAVLFSMVIFFSGYWLFKSTKNLIITVTGASAVLVSIPLGDVAKYIWSEPLFILFILLFMINIDDYLDSTSLKFLIGASVFASLACLTRYIGVTAIITGCVLLIIQNKRVVKRLTEVLIFGFISSVPTVIWVIRNYIICKTFTGERTPANTAYSENIDTTFRVVSSWFAPHYSHVMSLIMLGLLVFLSIILIIKYPYKSIGWMGDSKDRINELFIPFIFIIIYTTYLTISASLVSFDNINTRLLAPIFVPLIILAFLTFSNLLRKDPGHKIKRVLTRTIFIIGFTLWLLYPLSEIYINSLYSYENGAGILASKWWMESQILHYTKTFRESENLYSNYPDAVYIHSGKRAQYLPKKIGPPQYGMEGFVENLKNNGSSYIVWFNLDTTDTIYNVEELKEYFTVETIKKLQDGVIYKIVG